jgi:hypothetical protein
VQTAEKAQSQEKDLTGTETFDVDARVNADPRSSPKQFAGFKLMSASTTTSDIIPEVREVVRKDQRMIVKSPL